MDNLVSIIVINHNQKSLLVNCLNSIYAQTYKNIEVILVDNASDDGSVETAQQMFPATKILRNYSNELYAKAANKGIKASRGDFLLILNNDIILDKDYIMESLPMFFLDKRIGAVQGKILSESGLFIDSLGIYFSKGAEVKDIGRKKTAAASPVIRNFVFGCCGAASFYRKTMLREIRENSLFFDENLDFSYEDIDIAIRAEKAGWLTYFTPKAIAFHKRGATAQKEKPKVCILTNFSIPKLSDKLKVICLSNRYYILKKHMTLSTVLKNLFWILCVDIRNALFMTIFYPKLIIPVFNRTFTILKSHKSL